MQEERLLLKTLPIHLASYHPLNSQCQSNWTSQGLGYAKAKAARGMEMRRFSGIWGEEVVSAFLSAGATEIVAWQPWEHPSKQNSSKQFSQTFISSFQNCTWILLNVFQTIDSIELVSLLEFVGHSPVDLLVFVPGNLWLLPIVGDAWRGSLAGCFHRQNLEIHRDIKPQKLWGFFCFVSHLSRGLNYIGGAQLRSVALSNTVNVCRSMTGGLLWKTSVLP